MILKYDIEIDNQKICNRIKQLINLIYKLLPIREEDGDWQSLLSTIIEEISGIYRLIPLDYQSDLFILLSKLEGLFSLTQENDFFDFRRTVFECLNLMNKVKEHVSNG